MSAHIIPLHRPSPNTPRARLEKAIALSVELGKLVAPGFGLRPEFTEGAADRIAGVQVGLRATLAVMNAGPGPEAA